MNILASTSERVITVSTVVSVVVLVLLFIVLTVSFSLYFRYYKKCIVHRLEDDFLRGEIKKENKQFFKNYEDLLYDPSLSRVHKASIYQKNPLVVEVNRVSSAKKTAKVFLNIGFWIVYALFIGCLVFAIYVRSSGEQFMLGNSYYVIVLSGSMEEARKSNTYLEENKLTNQIPTFAMIGLNKVNSPEDIKLYDIVSYYDEDHDLIIHRVIGIEEKDGEYIYTLRGDANAYSSSYERELPYSAIEGIYNGYQNFGLGITINYLRSNIGIIAISLGLMLIGVYDVFDSMLGREIRKRKELLYPIMDEENLSALLGIRPRVTRDGFYLLPKPVYYPSILSDLKTIFASYGLTFKTNGVSLQSFSLNGDRVDLHLRLLNHMQTSTSEVESNAYRKPPLPPSAKKNWTKKDVKKK